MLTGTQATGGGPELLVRLAVAVVVGPVADLLRRPCERVAVLRLPVDAVRHLLGALTLTTLGRAELLVGVAVAVIVLPVAHLLRSALERVAVLHRPVHAARHALQAGPQPARQGAELLVGVAIAVVVQPVAHLLRGTLQRVALLRRPIDAGSDAVRALAQPTRDAPELLVRRSVAVVVQPVARLRRAALDLRTLLHLAVHARRHRLLAGTQAAGDRPLLLVGLAVAIVVLTVARLVLRDIEGLAPVDHCSVHARSRAPSLTGAYATRRRLREEVLVLEAVAVLVSPPAAVGRQRRAGPACGEHIAGVGRVHAGRHRRRITRREPAAHADLVSRAAVGLARRLDRAVRRTPRVPRAVRRARRRSVEPLVGVSIAVVIEPVARLARAWIAARVAVRAVVAVLDVVRPVALAQALRLVGIAVAVPVSVQVPGLAARRPGRVGHAVAVVVHSITHLVGARPRVRLLVVAVPEDLGDVGRRRRAETGEVVLDAEAVAVPIAVPDLAVCRVLFVGHAVAVVVDHVALLRRARIHRLLGIVAVHARGEPVAVHIVVQAVRDPVAVQVPRHLVGLTVAVVVDGVALLQRRRHGRALAQPLLGAHPLPAARAVLVAHRAARR